MPLIPVLVTCLGSCLRAAGSRALPRTAAASALVLLVALTVGLQAPAADAAPTMKTIQVSGVKVEYCSNGSLDPSMGVQTKWRRVVLVSHGSSNNACDYARYVEDSATKSGVASSTLVIAPHFRESASSSVMYWDSGWREGDVSRNGSPRTSSYGIIDEFLRRAEDSGKFPNVDRVVVTGHSAGGQVVQRYAAAHSADVRVTEYVVANPSSYLYFDDKRWANGKRRALTSSEKSACRGWNTYKYGTASGLNPYASAFGPAKLETNYRAAHVTYLLGDQDTDVNDSSLDKSCAASWQGRYRLERGKQYFSYIRESGAASHSLLIVPGVAHEGGSMYRSTQGQRALFG